MCKQHALRIAWTIARSIAFLDFRVLRWKFTYDWTCVNTTYRVPLFMPTACFPEGPSPPFTFCSFWRRRQRLEAVFRKRCICKKIHSLKVAWSVTQYPLHHVTYSGKMFEVAMFNGLGDIFTRKKKTHYLTLDLDRKFKVIENVESVQNLKLLCLMILEEIYSQETWRMDAMWTDDEPTLVCN